MSSTNKTENLGLNNWLGSDIPKREDFNSDNAILDRTIANHINNTNVHATASEREKWNSQYAVTTYYGNSASSREIALNISFSPSWGIVFAAGKPLSIVDCDNNADYNYFAIVSTRGSSIGATINGKTLKVYQSSTAISKTEFRNMNENGITYVCVLFR